MTASAPRILGTLKLAVATLVATASLCCVPALASAAPAAPTGVTAISLDARVALAWQPSSGASGYAVYRGTSATSITQLVSSSSIGATTFTDTSVTNGATYYYAVRAKSLVSGDSANSPPARATPTARSCSTGNAIVVENCFPGTTAWKLAQGTRAYDDGIEGFATDTSINSGSSVNLKINANAENIPYHIEIYRTGWYGGTQGRLISRMDGLRTVWQPGCDEDDTTGLIDCSDWEVSQTLTTTTDWVSGVYLLRLVRDDNGAKNDILLTIRKDGSTSNVLYEVPDTTYQAYNNYGGKSLYDTTSGGNRARKVSFDRPYSQPNFVGADRYDYYTRTDVETVGWLEQNGYDTTYLGSYDLNRAGAQAANHKILISGSHSEYWSTAMFNAAVAARDAGTSLAFMGANAVYWKIRFENGAGGANRVQVCYKVVQSLPADPVERTSTWRDPAGPNRPENSLIGGMYIGDNDQTYFPLQVDSAEGKNRFWRHTSLAALPTGTTASIGSTLVGWEWDARVENGLQPAGVQVLASSPVTGQLVQGNGASYVPGSSAVQESVLYRASSGAWVFGSGTNHWSRGLGRNADNVGEPDSRIQQAMVNLLQDAGARPTTPAAGMVVDPTGAPAVTTTNPGAGATAIVPTSSIKAVFDRELDPATVTPSTFRVLAPGGTAVPATVSMDNDTKTATLDPTESLEPFTTYTARLETGLKTWAGGALASAYTWTFTTGAGTPPTVTSTTPAGGATGVASDVRLSATFDRRLTPSSVTTSTASLTTSSGSVVPATAAYDDASRTVTITPSSRLSQSATYTARLTTGILASDGTAMSSPYTWSFSTGTDVAVTGRTPAAGSTGISPATAVRATFSRAADPATITTSSFRLERPDGSAVTAAVTYDAATNSAVLTPSASLSLSTAYTARVAGTVRAADGAPLDAATSWSFTTATSAPPAPAVTSLSPASAATGVPVGATVRATFDRALDPSTISATTVTLTGPGSTTVAAAVTYDDATRTITLRPSSSLAIATSYTARLTTGIRSSVGTPLASTVTWTFTTADCPCSLMSSLTPETTDLPVTDGRTGPGPYTYELGTKIAVDSTANLIALKYWKDPGETGTHVGRLWSSTGTQLAQVTFQNETTSGWQRQGLTTPVQLQAGQTYVVSIGLNTRYVVTQFGLQSQLSSGPLRTVSDGENGVFASAAGNFPTSSYHSSNYFVDGVINLPGKPARTPSVTSVSPLSGASGVSTSTRVTAMFNVPLSSSSVSTSTFTLTSAAGQSVPATVTYNDDTATATLRPLSPLAVSTTYTARLTTGIRSDDETPMASAYSWSFSTSSTAAPNVASTSPTAGATGISLGAPVTATFGIAVDPATVTTSTFTLKNPSGSAVPATVTYAAATNTASLTPSAPLNPSTTYTAQVTTGVRSTAGVPMDAAQTWSFTTNGCPCRLFASSLAPAATGLDTRDGRSGAGPFTYELGVKFTVTSPAELAAVRFWKDTGEAGAHVARLWDSSGALLASAAVTGETSSGWQEQALSAPYPLQPGETYTISIGFNAFFVSTTQGLADPITSGPLSLVVGSNGVFADSAGTFPTGSWRSSNYFVDPVVR